MTTPMRTVVSSVDGDYLDLEGPGCPADVIDALGDVVGPRSAWDQNGFLIRHEGLGVEIVLDYAPDTDPVSDTDSPTARLAIAELHGDDPLTRRGVAALLYQELATNTGWSLRWSSDNPSTGILTRAGATTGHVVLPAPRQSLTRATGPSRVEGAGQMLATNAPRALGARTATGEPVVRHNIS